ncbi:amidohydrolase [Leifsonia shinshuensis]|uniref:amidohydrolase n=1 Tax=Leifsonia shinshuensis TaxID=150026 RepID=UPI0028610FA5|nr:amidohydrolase [Leifsonia shinshuensis]MDR6971934.1 putative amidohydrolase YtcJ [Leifsonia shinshuensis]
MGTTVFTNGTILSSYRADAAEHDAVAVEDGRIVAVGEDARARRSSADETVDLEGGVLAPAFGDGHAHPLQGGLEQLGPQVRACGSVDEIVACVKEWADAHPEQEWIYGGSYDATLAPDGMFDARWLDAAVPDRPVVLRAWDYHTVWVNSEALRRAGIDAATPEPALGRIPRRADGSPLGILQEPGAVDLLLPAEPGRTREERVEALRLATADYAALGIAWVQDAWVEPAEVEAYLDAAARGFLSTRVNLALRADPVSWRDQVPGFVESRRRVEELGDPLLTARTVKVFVDGVIENHTAAMLDDYVDTPGDRGLPNWEARELAAAAVTFDKLGFQLHLHAIGDAAARTALDVFEEVERVNGPRDRRPVIAHVQVVDPVDLPRFERLGVIANFEPLWAQLDPMMLDLTLPRLGPERERLQYPIRTLLESGAVSFGSDWPVSSADWRPGVATAVTRQTDDRVPAAGWIPAERIPLTDALEAYSSGVAHQAFARTQRGELRPGSAPDLVWLDTDPRHVEPHDLRSVRVLGTWVDGVRRSATDLHHSLERGRST